MKKSLVGLTLFSVFALASCNFNFEFRYDFNIRPTHADTEGTTQDTSGDTSSDTGTSNTSEDTSEDSTGEESDSSDTSEDGPITPSKANFTITYKNLVERTPYENSICPLNGNFNILVIPVWFSNSSDFILEANKENVRNDIQKSFFGTDNETGWKSLRTYYQEDSFGAVNLSGTVSNWYNVSNSYVTYATDDEYYSKTTQLVKDAVSWYKTENSTALTDYDMDNDGFLDTVALIYAAPDYVSSGHSSYDNLWAYCYWASSTSSVTNPQVKPFIFASYDFMYGNNTAYSRTGKTNYSGGNTSYCSLDAHTYIHEMGHVFGLDDYYDYNKMNSRAPLGKVTMQDHNIGAHDPFTRVALGWTNPYVATNEHDNYEVTLNASESSGDMLIIANNAPTSPFDEYFLVDLYSPMGLNKFDVDHTYAVGAALPQNYGVRIFHIDARLEEWKAPLLGNSDWIRASGSQDLVTSMKPFNNDSQYHYRYTIGPSNTSGGTRVNPNLAQYDMNYYVRNLANVSDSTVNDAISDSNMFKQGDSFTFNQFKSQFGNRSTLNNGQSFDFTITVKQIKNGKATISVTL